MNIIQKDAQYLENKLAQYKSLFEKLQEEIDTDTLNEYQALQQCINNVAQDIENAETNINNLKNVTLKNLKDLEPLVVSALEMIKKSIEDLTKLHEEVKI